MEKTIEVNAPYFGVNDDEATLIKLNIIDGSFVNEGDIICIFETSKSTIELIAEESGFIQLYVKEGDYIKSGIQIGFISNKKENIIPTQNNQFEKLTRFTRKALDYLKINNYSIDLVKINKPIITERDLINFFLTENKVNTIDISNKLARINSSTVLIIGAGHGNISIAENLLSTGYCPSICFMDYSKDQPSDEISGWPIFSRFDFEKIRDKGCKRVIIHLPFKKLKSFINKINEYDFSYINSINPKSFIASNCEIGKSVYIGPNSSIETQSHISDFCYIGSNTIVGVRARIGEGTMVLNNSSIAHDSKIGVGCQISDGTRIAGRVIVGDRVTTGLNVTVNMDLKIADDITINSGTSLYKDVKNNPLPRN